jgi:hypothetical protein
VFSFTVFVSMFVCLLICFVVLFRFYSLFVFIYCYQIIHLPVAHHNQHHYIDIIPEGRRRKCAVCADRNNTFRKSRISTWCSTCDVGLYSPFLKNKWIWNMSVYFHLLPLDKWDLCKTGTFNVHSWAIKVMLENVLDSIIFKEWRVTRTFSYAY